MTAGVAIDLVHDDAAVDAHWWRWYDTQLFERRAVLDGVIAARRGSAAVGSVAHIAVYDLDDHAIALSADWAAGDAPPFVTTKVYRQLISTVEPYEPPDADVLHAAFFEVDQRHHDEFNDWYNTEHLHFVDEVDGYFNCRRFVAVDDDCAFLALYDVTTLTVANSDEVTRATASPWSDRVRGKLATYRERRVFTWERRA